MGEEGVKLFFLLGLLIGQGEVPPITNQISNQVAPIVEPYKCNAKPYKYLKGHMLSEVLSLKLPPNTRIYRYDDEAAQYDKTKNRLNIELDDKTFVRRVYCS